MKKAGWKRPLSFHMHRHIFSSLYSTKAKIYKTHMYKRRFLLAQWKVSVHIASNTLQMMAQTNGATQTYFVCYCRSANVSSANSQQAQMSYSWGYSFTDDKVWREALRYELYKRYKNRGHSTHHYRDRLQKVQPYRFHISISENAPDYKAYKANAERGRIRHSIFEETGWNIHLTGGM